ncbi:efflux RND transporter periplasmic adaptor subunit [Pelagicoccus albus]|uniref:Efflux RND transporter periplasmic adaptor subunit n=1 Tax=Pelagicoccus albus TaxID=415222 RepID=A0A7X1B8X0_9BACT|nr:efflux RND transporter periplasmic adaptor subunit [Pelagicoccus albus]MBC2607859.1 efflux RND transporter periplasmic adaptor subunit [Pelagicoccus albus]
MNGNLKKTLSTALAGLSLTLFGCGKKETAVQEPVRPVKLYEVELGTPDRMYEFPGRIQASQEANLAFEVAGRILEMPVREGELVQKGQLIARLDDRDYESDLHAAEARYEQAKSEYDRLKSLFDQNATAKAALEGAKVAFEAATAQRDIAKKRWEETRVYAPFAGEIAQILVNDFANVMPKQPIAVVQDISTLEAVVDIPETLWILKGEDATAEMVTEKVRPELRVTAMPEVSFPLRVSEFATRANPASRTFPVTLQFERPSEISIHPGMTARIRFWVPAKEDDALAGTLLPVSSIDFQPDGQALVWKYDPSAEAVSPVAVSVGQARAEEIEVTGDLKSGDLIVSSGVVHLREGMQVKPWK